MRHHWMEEAQHAKLDTLIVEKLGAGLSEKKIDRAIDEFFEIGSFLDEGLCQQAHFNMDALEQVIGRKLPNRADDHQPAAPGCALDLHRLGHGPRALQGDARSPLAARRRTDRRSRAAVCLNHSTTNHQGELKCLIP